jgi:hypothetical protein
MTNDAPPPRSGSRKKHDDDETRGKGKLRGCKSALLTAGCAFGKSQAFPGSKSLILTSMPPLYLRVVVVVGHGAIDDCSQETCGYCPTDRAVTCTLELIFRPYIIHLRLQI